MPGGVLVTIALRLRVYIFGGGIAAWLVVGGGRRRRTLLGSGATVKAARQRRTPKCFEANGWGGDG